ncbi:MAG: hypothetical protein ABIK28_13730 [Planctomycetota bacterium]
MKRSGADLIGLLCHAGDDTDLDALLALLQNLKGNDLIPLLRPHIERLLRDCLIRKYMVPDSGGYLATAFSGYQETDCATRQAVFHYSFKEKKELDDFELVPHPFFATLRRNQEPYENTLPLKIHDGAMTGYGTTSLILKPSFEGPIAMTVRFELIEHHEGQESIEQPSTSLHLGYGLGSEAGFICSSSFYHLCVQNERNGNYKLYNGLQTYEHLRLSQPYISSLKGDSGKVVLCLDESTTVVIEMEGERTGKVFIENQSPFVFRLHELEVRAKVDPAWHKKSVLSFVEKDLEEILSRLP